MGVADAGIASHDYKDITIDKGTVSLTFRIDWALAANELDMEVRVSAVTLSVYQAKHFPLMKKQLSLISNKEPIQ
ncbi:hypothetical protein [Cytobacillus oceanisediminis]|uniref:hypothetical protein n=1 Tax=Cytobacillus oceanisediminis TaxID=665099 RepID=UPI003735608B